MGVCGRRDRRRQVSRLLRSIGASSIVFHGTHWFVLTIAIGDLVTNGLTALQIQIVAITIALAVGGALVVARRLAPPVGWLFRL